MGRRGAAGVGRPGDHDRKDVAQSLLEDWLGERMDPPSWVSWVVIAGFGVVTLWVLGSALFGSSGTNTDETD
jgi:hypothetical protein